MIFMDEGVLTGLNANAAEGVRWVPGIKHPTFDWDSKNIPANYSKVDEAIAKAEALNKDNYKDFSAVETARMPLSVTRISLNRAKWMQWQRLLKMPLLPCNLRMPITQRLMQPSAKANA